MFNVDFQRLAIHLLPTFFRQPLIFGLLRAALVPLVKLYTAFLDKRAAQIYRVTHNCQVCYLQAALNDHFDPSARRIRVLSVERRGEWLYAVTEDGGTEIPVATEEATPVYETEQNPPYGRPPRQWLAGFEGGEDVPIVWDEIALTAQQNSFVVTMPSVIYQTSLEAVKQLVDTYKLMSKRAIYTPQASATTSDTNNLTLNDVLNGYRYGYLTDAVLGTAKADKLNIISNADSRLYK